VPIDLQLRPATGVDYASSGWITHSASSLDVAPDIEM
jgi:nicotinate-nucleotide pyrophosphorylase